VSSQCINHVNVLLSNVANTHFRAIDYAGFPEPYISEPWFKNVKERWQSNTYGLTRFIEKPMIRSDVNGTSLVKFELFPLYFRAPKEEDGLWSEPYFDCDGYVNEWIVTYSVPFFGLNSVKADIEFKSVLCFASVLCNCLVLQNLKLLYCLMLLF